MNDLPEKGEFFFCFSRASVLKCISRRIRTMGQNHDKYLFEYVTASKSKWARTSDGRPQTVGCQEWIGGPDLTPLSRINEMEVLAYASRGSDE